jgi:hypothetical protein
MRFAQPWIDRAARIGADPADDGETRIRKALLVLISVLILPIAVLWGAIYLAFGVWAGLIAWLYLVISVVALIVFARTRDTEWLLRVELVDILRRSGVDRDVPQEPREHRFRRRAQHAGRRGLHRRERYAARVATTRQPTGPDQRPLRCADGRADALRATLDRSRREHRG